MKHWLFSFKGWRFLLEEYVTNERSTHDIAKELGTTHKRVLRALLHHRIKPRTRSQAQEAAMRSGRAKYPRRDYLKFMEKFLNDHIPGMSQDYRWVVPSWLHEQTPDKATFISSGCLVIPELKQ